MRRPQVPRDMESGGPRQQIHLAMEASACPIHARPGPGGPGEVGWGGRDQPHPKEATVPPPGVGEEAQRGGAGKRVDCWAHTCPPG